MDGVILKKKYINFDKQKEILDILRNSAKEAPFYQPSTYSGAKMNLQMLCLGWHWNPKTYKYEQKRTDHDNLPAPNIPEALNKIAATACTELWGSSPAFDVCIINLYDGLLGKLGIHQDRDEDEELIKLGSPVLSISMGCAASFSASMKKTKDFEKYLLESGDVLIFGGAARLCYHGVNKVFPNTAPAELPTLQNKRLNLTFRQAKR